MFIFKLPICRIQNCYLSSKFKRNFSLQKSTSSPLKPRSKKTYSTKSFSSTTPIIFSPMGISPMATSPHSNPEVAGSSLARSQCPYGSGFTPRLRLAGWRSAR
ncbi:hypothetical protein Hanom_Chr02g00168971 [Helianthus anomalus]